MRWQDLQHGEDGDLVILNGDLVIDTSTEQESVAILMSSKGNFKNDPILGSDLHKLKFSKGDNLKVKQAARLALERDNKVAKAISINDDGTFQIDEIIQK